MGYNYSNEEIKSLTDYKGFEIEIITDYLSKYSESESPKYSDGEKMWEKVESMFCKWVENKYKGLIIIRHIPDLELFDCFKEYCNDMENDFNAILHFYSEVPDEDDIIEFEEIFKKHFTTIN